jgi:flagellin-specific chaperone FliS
MTATLESKRLSKLCTKFVESFKNAVCLYSQQDLEHLNRAASSVLNVAESISSSLRPTNTPFSFQSEDALYHEIIANILLYGPQEKAGVVRWGSDGEVPECAVLTVLKAYSALVWAKPVIQQLAKVKRMIEGLLCAFEQGTGSNGVKPTAAFLLSQIALAGQNITIRIATLPSLPDACFKALSSAERASKKSLANETALLINNLAAMGGRKATIILTANSKLMQELGFWLDNSHDAETLQCLAGIFNHLSRSVESASALQAIGIMDHLIALTKRQSIEGSTVAHEAYIGLANMAMANIAARQQHTAPMVFASQTNAIKSIVGFLKCAIEKRYALHSCLADVADRLLEALRTLAVV